MILDTPGAGFPRPGDVHQPTHRLVEGVGIGDAETLCRRPFMSLDGIADFVLRLQGRIYCELSATRERTAQLSSFPSSITESVKVYVARLFFCQ